MGGVDGEHKVDVGWLNEAVDGGSQKGMISPGWGREDGGKGMMWTEEKSGGIISKQRPEGLLGGQIGRLQAPAQTLGTER